MAEVGAVHRPLSRWSLAWRRLTLALRLREVKRLEVLPGDRLVLRLGFHLTDAEADEAQRVVRAVLKIDVPVLVVGPGEDIGVIGPEAEDAAKRAALKVLLDAGHDPAVARAVLGMGPEADGA